MFFQWTKLGVPLALASVAKASFNIYAAHNHHAIAAALGISSQCLLALNQTIECDQPNAARAARGVDNDFWYPSNLTDLCTIECSNSLASWLSVVEEDCSRDRVTANGIIFDPKAFPLKYIAGHDLACLQDASETFCILESQKWDDSVYTKWDVEACYEDDAPAGCSKQVLFLEGQSMSVTNMYQREQYCSECFLLLWRQRLLSPTLPPGNFTDYLIDQFKVLEETCSTELPFTTSAPILIFGTSPTPLPTKTVNSRRWVAPDASPTPNRRTFRISKSFTLHGGPYYSTAIPPKSTQPGAIEACGAYYTVVPGDTCLSIARQLGVEIYDLLRYNTQLNSDCTNLWNNYAICIAPVATQTSTRPAVPTDTKRNNPPGIPEDHDDYDEDEDEDDHPPKFGKPTTPVQPDGSTKAPEPTTSVQSEESTKAPESTGKPDPLKNISRDGKCSEDIGCVGSGFGDCCSTSGYCGSGPQWCGIGNCISGPCNSEPGQVSTDGRCGPRFPGLKICVGSTFGDCCSKRGYCGSTESYCAPENCHSGNCYGKTDDDEDED